MRRLGTTPARLATALLVLGGAAWAMADEKSGAETATVEATHLQVERLKSGFFIAPDNRFAELDGRFANLTGAYAGWMTDQTLLIGAGGYWMTNGSRDFKMSYGGLVVAWLVHGDRRFGFGARALIGGGGANLSSTLGELGIPTPLKTDRDGRFEPFHWFPGAYPPGTVLTSGIRVITHEGFFVAEPQADLSWKVKDWLRLHAGVGYRLIGGAGRLENRLRGVSGSVALQVGGV